MNVQTVYSSIHPFDHLAFMLSSMYAKASRDASHKNKNTYKHKTLSLFFPLLLAFLPLFMRHQNSFYSLKLILFGPCGGNATCVKDNYLHLSALVTLTVCAYPLQRYIVTKAIGNLKTTLAHCSAKLK